MFGNDNMFGAGGVSTGFYDTTIDQSLRFNDNDSAYLSRTPASAGNRKTWTWSGWVKRSTISNPAGQGLMYYYSGGTGGGIYFNTSGAGGSSVNDTITLTNRNATSGSGDLVLQTSALHRDVSAWYHIIISVDTTQATSSNRVKMYVNGKQITQFIDETYPAQNYDFNGFIGGTAVPHRLGWANPTGGDGYFDGYLAEVNFIDGQALTADSFGEFKSGVWIPKAYSGSYGTNGFHLEFGNSGSLGADTSGNGNTWSAYNLASTDQMLDSPTNNFATVDPLNNHLNRSFGLSQGNLQTGTSSSTWTTQFPNFLPSTGQHYFEVYIGSSPNCFIGAAWSNDVVVDSSNSMFGYATESYGYRSSGGVWQNGSNIDSGYASYTTGDVIGVSFDADNGKIYWSKNGTWQDDCNPSAGTGGKTLGTSTLDGYYLFGVSSSGGVMVLNFGQDSSFAGNKTAQGNQDANGIGDFYYAPPTDYLALCTANLPEPAISPLDDASPSDHFNTVIYTGAGSDNQSITGVGFSPDMTWIKMRDYGSYHHIQDVTFPTQSGYYNYLSSNSTSAYQNDGPGYGVGFKSFDSDGFTIDDNSGAGGLGWSGHAFVSWNWKANGSGVSNTDGSTTSTVSANTDTGFSIVRYTGTGSATTVGHGLDEAPDMMIIKAVDYTTNWPVYHSSLGATHNLILDQTVGQGTTAAYWNNTEPTSSVFTINNAQDCNRSGTNYIAYCFHSVEGYSKFGKYTGNGSADGTFVYTGFKPAFVLSKRVDVSGYSWAICDNKRSNYNLADEHLYANVSDSEYTTLDKKDLLSNGFKHRTNLYGNLSGGTYIYMAFAENPFKYTTAR